jgi:N-acetylneuraminic acid mutarotase
MPRAVVVGFLLALTSGCTHSEPEPDDAPARTPEKTFAWTEVTGCPVPRFEAMGVVVDDEVWVMGGFLSTKLDVTKRIDIYDPSTDSWRLGPELPDAETHAGVVNVERDFMLLGGFVGNVHDRITSAGVWRWNAAGAVWTTGINFPSPRAAVALALLDTKIYAAAGLAEDGNTDSGEHLILDLAGDDGWTPASPLPNPRNHGGGAASGGSFFAVAGRHGWDEVDGHVPTLDAFDPATDTWHSRAPMPLGRSEIGASTLVLADGRLVTIGGSVPGKKPSDDVLVYDPAADAWSELAPLPIPLKGVVAARVGDKLIVTTGSPTSIDPSALTYVGCCL